MAVIIVGTMGATEATTPISVESLQDKFDIFDAPQDVYHIEADIISMGPCPGGGMKFTVQVRLYVTDNTGTYLMAQGTTTVYSSGCNGSGGHMSGPYNWTNCIGNEVSCPSDVYDEYPQVLVDIQHAIQDATSNY